MLEPRAVLNTTGSFRATTPPEAAFKTTNLRRETVYLRLDESELCISQGSAVTFFRHDGQVHSHSYNSLYPPSERSETGGYTVLLGFPSVLPSARTQYSDANILKTV